MNTIKLDTFSSPLGSYKVAEAMHEGVITCSPLDELGQVAAAMTEHGIHCVVAVDQGPPGADDDRLWGVISDIDLMRGLCSAVRLDAGNLAALDVIATSPDETLDRAAQLMAEHEVAHLVVVAEDRPVGVISTLDIARVAAGAGR